MCGCVLLRADALPRKGFPPRPTPRSPCFAVKRTILLVFRRVPFGVTIKEKTLSPIVLNELASLLPVFPASICKDFGVYVDLIGTATKSSCNESDDIGHYSYVYVDAWRMSQREKLIARFRKKPRDFTWDEAVRLLAGFGYEEEPGEGSRRKFFNSARNVSISMHEPHPGKELRAYQIRDLQNHLKQEGCL